MGNFCLYSKERKRKKIIRKELYPNEKIYIQNEILNELSKSVCKIIYEYKNSMRHGTGFFMNCIFSNIRYLFLVSNYHVISENLINKEIKIELHNKEIIPLKLDTKFFNINFFKESFDVTTIQINNNMNENVDKILENVEFLDCDMNYLNGYEQYKKETILSSGYPPQEGIYTSLGKITSKNDNNELKYYEFEYVISRYSGSSGSPIVLLNNQKVIGIHKRGNITTGLNEGTFIGIIIDKLKEKIKNNNEVTSIKNNQNINNDNSINNNINQTKLENNNTNNISIGENKIDLKEEIKSNNEIINDISYREDLNKDTRKKNDIDNFNNINNTGRDEVDFKENLKKRNRIDIYDININNNGNKYEVEFKDGLKEGKGKDYYINGDRYEGYFKKGLREGKGIYYWNNGDKYEGDFKNGIQEGKGILF